MRSLLPTISIEFNDFDIDNVAGYEEHTHVHNMILKVYVNLQDEVNFVRVQLVISSILRFFP